MQRGHINRSKGNKDIDDSAFYSPSSTPLTWSSDLYVQGLLQAKRRLEILECQEQERDHKIHDLTVANQTLTESNKFLKEQLALFLKEQLPLLQEALLVGKNKWQDMKVAWQAMKEFVVESKGDEF